MPDAFGVPENMFGAVPEQFYGLLGRIVMISALLDVRLLDLLTALEQAPQDEHAGRSGSELARRCRLALVGQNIAYRREAEAAPDLTQAVLETRNGLVHSVWPAPTAAHAVGWRPVFPGHRPRPGDPHAAVALTEEQGRRLVHDGAAAVGCLARLTATARGSRIDDP